MSDAPSSARAAGSARRHADPAAALYGLLATVARGAPRDMGLTSAATLATLERTGPRRITDLAATEGVAQPSMTVLITTLERSGLVERHSDPADKRATLVALTPAGSQYLLDRRQAGTDRVARLIGNLPPDEAAALAAAVPALTHLRELHYRERESPARASD